MSEYVLTADILRALFDYDPLTGTLYWRHRADGWFKDSSDATARSWNTRFAGKVAFTSRDKNGYMHGSLFGKQYYAHRIIWCIVYGYWPIQVDHGDGNRANNRLNNLDDGTQSDNMKNTKLRNNNSTGVPGVSWDARRNKWYVRVQSHRKCYFIGMFYDYDEAVRARYSAERKYAFHPNHGKR